MEPKRCIRCDSKFFAAFPEPHQICPFCGYSTKRANLFKRTELREITQKTCELSNGFGLINTATVDSSSSGLGLSIKTKTPPFRMSDIVHVKVNDLQVDSEAQVMWLQTSALQNKTRVGLRYCTHQ